MQNAVRIAEDSRFFEHDGIDYEALKEAIKKDWERKEFAFGASTITMQLARNLFLEPDKSIGRKLREMIITYKLERTLSKKRILELYLNVVQFGNCIYGVEEAAIHYFGKSASQLNRYESAFLAALLPKPAYYQKHPDGKFFNSRIDFIVDKL